MIININLQQHRMLMFENENSICYNVIIILRYPMLLPPMVFHNQLLQVLLAQVFSQLSEWKQNTKNWGHLRGLTNFERLIIITNILKQYQKRTDHETLIGHCQFVLCKRNHIIDPDIFDAGVMICRLDKCASKKISNAR